MNPNHFHNPNKHVLEAPTQARQDAIENGYGTHASGFDYVPSRRFKSTDEWDGNDLVSPFLSRDRRFVIRIEVEKARDDELCEWFDSLPKPPEPLPWVPQEKATDRHPFA